MSFCVIPNLKSFISVDNWLVPFVQYFIYNNKFLSEQKCGNQLFIFVDMAFLMTIIIRINGTVNKLDVYNTSKRQLLL